MFLPVLRDVESCISGTGFSVSLAFKPLGIQRLLDLLLLLQRNTLSVKFIELLLLELEWKYILPAHISRSNSVSCSTASLICIPHFFYNSDLLHKQAGPSPGKTGSGPRHAEILIIPNSE